MPKFEYAPAPESRSIVSLRESYGLFINGEFGPSVDGRAFKTISPATEEVLAEVTEAGPADVDRAVTAARKAYEHTWSAMPGRERAKYLFRIARIVQARARAGGGPRARGARVTRQRKADPRVARRGHPAGRGALLLLRRLGRQAGVRRLRPGAAPARRGRPGAPVG